MGTNTSETPAQWVLRRATLFISRLAAALALIVALIIPAVLIGIAPAAAVPPPCSASNPGCQIVPGMQDGVEGQPCSNWTRYTYGFGPSGEFLACASFDGGRSGIWSRSATISAGAKQVGSPCCPPEASYCPTGWGAIGQALDGRPLYCSNASGTWAWAAWPKGNLG
jgi:hypothetical protein